MEKDIAELEAALAKLTDEVLRVSIMMREIKHGIVDRSASGNRSHPAKGTSVKPGVTVSHLRPVPTVTAVGPTDSSAHD